MPMIPSAKSRAESVTVLNILRTLADAAVTGAWVAFTAAMLLSSKLWALREEDKRLHLIILFGGCFVIAADAWMASLW